MVLVAAVMAMVKVDLLVKALRLNVAWGLGMVLEDLTLVMGLGMGIRAGTMDISAIFAIQFTFGRQ